jgi:hypothetical protein
MANPGVPAQQLQESVDAVAKYGSITEAAKKVGVHPNTFRNRYDKAVISGFKPGEFTPTTEQSLKDKIRELEAQIATHHRVTIDERMIKEKIIKLAELKPEPPGWLVANAASKTLPGVPTLFASDWHWGEVVDPDQIGGVNEYDLAIAQKRAKLLIERAIDLLNNHVVNPQYPGIVFVLGGDMVSGDIHEELSATNEQEIMPVVLDLVGVLIWCIKTLADQFGQVYVPCVTGNHGRNTKKMRAKGRAYTSFDWLIYAFLAKHFQALKDERVQFSIPTGPDCLYRIYGHRYLLTHGDQFRGGDGQIGAIGPLTRGNKKKLARNTAIKREYDTMICGHWHQYMPLPRLIVNGSLKGYDEYANANNFECEAPQQALWLTHPDHGITFHMPVILERKKGTRDMPWVAFKNT